MSVVSRIVRRIQARGRGRKSAKARCRGIAEVSLAVLGMPALIIQLKTGVFDAELTY